MGEEYQPFNEESHAIWVAMLRCDSGIAPGYVRPQACLSSIGSTARSSARRKDIQDFTSLSLFRDDVERLLRDLYGDVESEALDRVLRAVFRIVQELTKYVRPDLWKEHSDAEDLDYILGIGVPEGYGISAARMASWNEGKSAISFAVSAR